jgi:hypothetical protein
METVEESDSCDCSIYEPSLPTGQSGRDKISLSQFCKKFRKKRNTGSGYVFEKTTKQGLELKVDFEQTKLLRESSEKPGNSF